MTATADFLRRVLPTRGRYCHAVKPHTGFKGFKHTWVSTREELAALQERDGARMDRDTYFALAGFGESPKREAANALYLRALWVDIDCGPGKPFATQDAGLDALEAFLDRGWPDYTLVVSSGWGLHAYWELSEDALIGDWLLVAGAFQRALISCGLDSDHISADAARVLRAPGTQNLKRVRTGGPAVPVRVLEDTRQTYTLAQLSQCAQAFSPSTPLPLVAPAASDAPARDTGVSADDLMANLPGREAWLSAIVSRCAQIRAIAQDKGATCPEPLWYATVQLCRHLVNGVAAAHHMSSGHPEYTPEAVDGKLAQLEAKDVGPTTCARFKTLNAAGCENCFWAKQGKVKSPIQLGEKDPEAVKPQAQVTSTDVDDAGNLITVERTIEPPVEPPDGFLYTADGTMAKVIDSKGLPTWQRAFPGVIWPTRVYRGPNRPLEIEVFSQRHGTGETRTFTMAAAKIGDPRETRQELMSNVLIDAAQAPLLQKLLNAMSMSIQQRARTGLSVQQLGWQMSDPSTERHFVFGRTRLTPESVEREIVVASSLTTIADQLCVPHGSLEGALEGARLFEHPGAQMHQAIYLTGLCGVFAPFTGAQNFAALSLVTRIGGEGKTTMCDAAMSHWFNPKLTRSDTRDTANALFNTMSCRGTLPVFIDEVTNIKPEAAVDLIYTASQGREKARMDSSGTRTRDPLPPWKAPLLVTANTSIRQLVRAGRGDAAALDARVVEIQFERLDLPPAEAKLIGQVWYRNFGWTGPTMAQHVVRNYDTYARTAEVIQERLILALGRDQADRFWVNWAVGVLLACRAANALGWVNYDLNLLFGWIQKLLLRQRAAKIAEMRSAPDILAEFLAEMGPRIIVAWRLNGADTGPERTYKLVTVTDPSRHLALIGRSQLDERVLYLGQTAVRDWCQAKGYDYASFVSECANERLLAGARVVGRKGGAKDGALVYRGDVPDRVSLGRGTALASAPTRTLAFSMDHPALVDHRTDAELAAQASPGFRIQEARG